jgi:hypothetical protein
MTDPRIFQRVETDGLLVEFELATSNESTNRSHARITDRERDAGELAEIAEQLRAADTRINILTNQSDRLDHALAAGCGVLAGIVDSVWVGAFSLAEAHKWGAKKVNEFVLRTAKAQTGYEGNDLAAAIRRLEGRFPIAGDKARDRFGGAKLHHLRDLTHHPTPVGLIASIAMQFTGQAWGMSDRGLQPIDVGQDAAALIGKTVPEKLLFGTVRWLFHLVSDVAGSSQSAGEGMGIPGPLLSLVHEAGAALQHLNLSGERENARFFKWVEGVFQGSRQSDPFDFRTELGLVNAAGRQALPVLLTEMLVRGVYFVRRAVHAFLEAQPKTFQDLLAVALRPALPWGNRTITRMVTIASSTFTAIDLLDAGIRAALASGGDVSVFTGKFLLRVNFVGVGRTSLAIGIDVHLGMKRSSLRTDRIALMNRQLELLNARTSYQVNDTWVAAGEAAVAVNAAREAIAVAGPAFIEMWSETRHSTAIVEQRICDLRAVDPVALGQALEDLEWGIEP